jgi:DNA polymerase
MNRFSSRKLLAAPLRADGKILSCVSCGLYKECKSPKMQPFGNFKKKILNIGEAPGETEDERGKPWQGKTGRLLVETYKKVGIDLFEDCLNINSVNCRPIEDGGNITPSNYQIDCCRKNVLRIIMDYKPKVIALFGNSAVYSIIGHRWKKDLGGIMKWRGWTIPDRDFNCWICPTFHPSYIERSDNIADKTIWLDDLTQITEKAKEKMSIYTEPIIDIIEDLNVLINLRGIDRIAIDYETTGLKPHASGHRIVCASVADSENHAYAFLMPQTREGMRPFVTLLANPAIGKMAHNMKFEEAWSVVRLRQPVQNWIWDSMLAAHIFDNRPGITSLKFQTYVQFGIVDYASEVSPYLQAKDNIDGNAINQIFKLVEKPGGKDMLLRYNALDTIYEYRLAMKQQKQILPF